MIGVEKLKLNVTKFVVKEKFNKNKGELEVVFSANYPTKQIVFLDKTEIAKELLKELKVFDISEKRFLKGWQYFKNKNLFKFQQFENRLGDYVSSNTPDAYQVTYLFKCSKA